ncbi:hypothetical protein CDAR_102461 [Caerostris darwini]|uniref:Uncharacterized protein n=1 Tax=Caerostris darwini TaxID=1538125 RepID=A0AAV4R0U3_9ARAC|nr:hypothetical protein CDAR_102461 [Caerostris darwini]
MELEGAEGNGLFQVPLEVPLQRSNEIFYIEKEKTRCQEITTTQADIKMLETQLAVAHDWNGTAKDVAQGHCQTQQTKKLSSLGSCSLINCPKDAINNSVKPKRNSNHLTSNNLSIDEFQYPNKKLIAKTSYNDNDVLITKLQHLKFAESKPPFCKECILAFVGLLHGIVQNQNLPFGVNTCWHLLVSCTIKKKWKYIFIRTKTSLLLWTYVAIFWSPAQLKRSGNIFFKIGKHNTFILRTLLG